MINVLAFAGASNWPLWAATERGYFAAEGLDVHWSVTPNSREMAAALFDGRCQIALTAIDNVVAYVEGQGEALLDGDADFFAFMGVDDGMLSIMARPEVESVADLRGREASVDAMTTGFAFALRDMLSRCGLSEGDVSYVRVGGGAERLAALREGRQAVTLLNAPLDLMAIDAGCRRLVRARDILGAYQGVVGAARRSWANAHEAETIGFIRAFHRAIAWLIAPSNRDDAISLLLARMKGATPALGEKAYERLLVAEDGIRRDLAIDRAGVATVLALRSRYGQPTKQLEDPARYMDDRFRAAALAPTAARI